MALARRERSCSLRPSVGGGERGGGIVVDGGTSSGCAQDQVVMESGSGLAGDKEQHRQTFYMAQRAAEPHCAAKSPRSGGRICFAKARRPFRVGARRPLLDGARSARAARLHSCAGSADATSKR